MEYENEISLVEIFNILKEKWLLILTVTMLCATAAFTITKFVIDETFTAEAKIIIVQQKDSAINQSVNINDINLSQKLVSTYTEIMRSEAILDIVAANLDLDMSTKKLNELVSISSASGTEVMKISVETKDPLLSANIANEVVKVFRNEIFDIMQIENVTVLNPAKIPELPSGPKTALNTLIGLMLGGVLSVLYVLVISMMNNKVKTEEELVAVVDYPVIGIIPDYEFFDDGGRA